MTSGPENPEQPQIGVDQWVASVDERTVGNKGVRMQLDRIPHPAWFAAFVVATLLLPLFTNNGYVLTVGFDTLIYMLLALGLNVVVGFAGLLDLGYVAFFGFGAYGYAMLSSSQFNNHFPTLLTLLIVTIATVLLGFIVALPSRRLVGDYMAILTLFFLEFFVTVTQNGESISFLGLTRDINLTNGPNGIANIDAFHIFGHALQSLRSYYYLALAFFLGVLGVVHLVNRSRTGRAWRAIREDSLAAELTGTPVNRLKLYAFGFGAGVAGLTGTLFASFNSAVFSSDFDAPLLITIYAILILGGAGSLGGVILGAVVVNVTLEVLRTPNHATWVFFILIAATLVAKLRPWWLLGVTIVSTLALGFAVYGIADAINPKWTSGTGAVTGTLGEWLSHWTPIPPDPMQIGNYAFIALTVGVLALTTVRPLYRNILLPVVLYLAVYAWNARLAFEPSITRLIMIGVILIVLMNVRPQGLMGQTRVEIA